MITELDEPNRQLIPRWVPFLDSKIITPTMKTETVINPFEKDNYKKLINEWDEMKTIPFAIELILTSHALDLIDTPDYKEAIDFILSGQQDLLEMNPFLSEILGKRSLNRDSSYNIKILKTMCQININDPSIWIDLAYFYETIGQRKSADKAIRIAMNLYPNNPILLRSLSKFFILRNNIDFALYVLNNSENLNNHPLIISAEISISQTFNVKSKLLRKGMSFINSKDISKPYENELFATIGTLEFNNSNSKKGKKLINQSLYIPNENILAQARYLSTKFQKDIDIHNINIPNRYETDSWIAYNEGNYNKVIEHSENWFYFQPFSPYPAIMNTYINSLIFENEKKSIEIAKKALLASPDNFSLLNNLTVAAYRDNDLALGNKYIEKLRKCSSLKNNDDIVLIATNALADYRNGNKQTGRAKYQNAVEQFKINNDFEKMARCLYYWGCEAKNSNENDYTELIRKSKELSIKYKFSELLSAIERNFKI